ncbi:TraB/GumN family protein [Burkholderia sp. Ax-1719]|uniref:TraB/GumN family protein n=1 Tax=Burkholderia sp. Ax-1719 TaxID=2608334 RepID=UPI0014241411|nr:TraB/GumN family protein [Burkholderia sp. Ax-1719]
MRQSNLRLVGSWVVPALAFVFCAMATDAAHAEEGVFWEARAPGRPVLLLMPTLHFLPDPAQDINQVLERVIMRVSSVVTESPMTDATPVEAEVIKQMEIYPPTDSLENHFGAEGLDALHACAANAHMPYPVFTRIKPWALTLLVARRLKTPPTYAGIETRLVLGAQAAHRSVSSLLTAVENMEELQEMPARLQKIDLLETCKRFDRTVDNQLLQDLTKDWRQGDVRSLAVDVERPTEPGDVPELKQVGDFTKANGSSLYMEALLSERIQAMTGPILVAVGAAHLVGEPSMLTRLAKAGYTVRRTTLDQYPEIPLTAKVAASASHD